MYLLCISGFGLSLYKLLYIVLTQLDVDYSLVYIVFFPSHQDSF
jgi:hypothetical protein